MISLFMKICLLMSIFIRPGFAEEDNLGRLISFPGKKELPCPLQSNKTGVIVAIGQSNIANHGEKRMQTKYPAKVYNYFNGKCYLASSPLLGSTGMEGEFLTPLADKLIDLGVYEQVILISSGIGGTAIAYWQKGAPLNQMLQSVLDELKSKYQITDIIWHQGETDFFVKTPPEKYRESFNSLISTLRSTGKNTPPVYYAIATLCDPKWYANNSLAQLQQQLASAKDKIYLAANTDQLVPINERYGKPPCHFSEVGQKKAADAFAKAIAKNKLK